MPEVLQYDIVKQDGDIKIDQPKSKISNENIQKSDDFDILPTLLINRDGGIQGGITRVSSTYTARENDMYIRCDASSGSFNVTLPNLGANLSKFLFIGETSGSNIVTIKDSSATILSQVLGRVSGYNRTLFAWDGSTWDKVL